MAVVCPECDNPIVVDVDEVEEGETVSAMSAGWIWRLSRSIRWRWRLIDVAGYDDEDPHAYR